MSTAEWGVALGAIGTISGVGGLLWRVFEWVTVRRRAVKVMAFAEQFHPARNQGEIVPLEKVAWSGVRIHLINEGRPISVDSVGLQDRKTGKQYVVFGPEGLPAQLQTHGTLDIYGDPGEEWKAVVRAGSTFTPYAEDGEGHTYKGWHDKAFDLRVRALVAQFDEWMQR